MEIPEKYIMKLSGSVLEYGNDPRYDRKIKERIFSKQNGCVVPVCYNYIHEIGSLVGMAELKENEKGVSADCYVIDTAFTRKVKELLESPCYELAVCINKVKTFTHGDETIVTEGNIREVSIVQVGYKPRFPFEVTENE